MANSDKIIKLLQRPVHVRKYLSYADEFVELPVLPSKVKAGIPSPINNDNDLHKMTVKTLLIKNYDNTYISNVEGNSMEPLIHEGDTLIIEELRSSNTKNLKKLDGRLIMAEINYEYAVKRLKVEYIDGEEVIYLISDNPEYKPIKIYEGDQFRVWGLISKIIKNAAYI